MNSLRQKFIIFQLTECVLCVADIKAHVNLNGELEDKDGNHYINFNHLGIDLKVGHGKIKLENLFGGEKVLSK